MNKTIITIAVIVLIFVLINYYTFSRCMNQAGMALLSPNNGADMTCIRQIGTYPQGKYAFVRKGLFKGYALKENGRNYVTLSSYLPN